MLYMLRGCIPVTSVLTFTLDGYITDWISMKTGNWMRASPNKPEAFLHSSAFYSAFWLPAQMTQSQDETTSSPPPCCSTLNTENLFFSLKFLFRTWVDSACNSWFTSLNFLTLSRSHSSFNQRVTTSRSGARTMTRRENKTWKTR